MLFTHAISESFLKVIFCVITAFKKGHFDETIKRIALRGLVQAQQSECSSSRQACLLPLPPPGQTPAPSMGGQGSRAGLHLAQLGDSGEGRTLWWTQISVPSLISGDLGKSSLHSQPQVAHLHDGDDKAGLTGLQ